jgi:hypothetical protein
MPKHEGQETVASLDSQNLQMGASDELAAPQLGQLRVSASIFIRLMELVTGDRNLNSLRYVLINEASS